jgi:hypothetical protein
MTLPYQLNDQFSLDFNLLNCVFLVGDHNDWIELCQNKANNVCHMITAIAEIEDSSPKMEPPEQNAETTPQLDLIHVCFIGKNKHSCY